MQKLGVVILNLSNEIDASTHAFIQNFLTLEQFYSKIALDWTSVVMRLQEAPYQLVLALVKPETLSGLEPITHLRRSQPQVGFIAIVLGGHESMTQQLVASPIDDFVFWPASWYEVLARLQRFIQSHALSPHDDVDTIKHDLLVKYGLKRLVGHDPKFCQALVKVRHIAGCDVPVLLCGETGTGKELFARALHYLSCRASMPFIPINCAAIPAELFENELFGHVKGAFTGATERQAGLVQAAAGGTLFLDEVDSLATAMQAKLLRFLEEKEYKPLGLNQMTKADVRIIAAARHDLRRKVHEGTFRDDLFYRLNVVSLFLPPLRERRSDIPLLARHFLQHYATQLAKPVTDFGPEVLDALERHSWPGNIRELENVVQHAVAVCQTHCIHLHDLDLQQIQVVPAEKPARSFKDAKAEAIANFERQFIIELLRAHKGNISHAAIAAHKNRRAFWEMMRKHRINPMTTGSEEGGQSIFL